MKVMSEWFFGVGIFFIGYFLYAEFWSTKFETADIRFFLGMGVFSMAVAFVLYLLTEIRDQLLLIRRSGDPSE
ncbi:MAG: hypothetical protein CL483_01870 [Acidobacteria bacterium]|nr:hypothetical protein [Acidobacteriota bacterium]|tara:strand:+ start:781 stop:999 length:219 start_codon:yes stop_codon:yes gene_type:complete